MCGIFCSVSRHDYVPPSDAMQQLLSSRGPDASQRVSIRVPSSPHSESGSGLENGAFLICHSTVLSLRSPTTVIQPCRDALSGAMLCWNGEAWSIRGERPAANDTTCILDLLRNATVKPIPPADTHQALFHASRNVSVALSQVAGPYAFVFYDVSNARLFFGRDFLGRRSLLWRVTERGELLLASVADGFSIAGWSEVEADGIYCAGLSVPPHSTNGAEGGGLERWGDFMIARVPYSYSTLEDGAVHSVIPYLSLNRHLPSTHPVLDHQSFAVSKLEQLLTDSLLPRVSKIPDPPPLTADADGRHGARLAVLFSGGLDCTVLARMTHRLLPSSEPIDLLNVAFENPRVHKDKGVEAYELCPDRITGRASYVELCELCPDREWRFVSINIPYTETQMHRQQVTHLIYPHATEMDLSIAFALYFASRGKGELISERGGRAHPYTTSARVLLSGLGADELFAGYTRHATAFNRRGHQGLLDELALDIGRLGKRNLGRDDRVICHWGREVRFPFLDEELVRWALATPVTDKCDFGKLEDSSSVCIEPGKKVLRCLAWKLGMTRVAHEKKRAIQFGARTAKMETGKTKGTNLLS